MLAGLKWDLKLTQFTKSNIPEEADINLTNIYRLPTTYLEINCL